MYETEEYSGVSFSFGDDEIFYTEESCSSCPLGCFKSVQAGGLFKVMYNFGIGSSCSASKQCLCKNKKIPNFKLYRKENTCIDYMINYADCNFIRRRYKYYPEITNITDASLPRGCLIKHTVASGPDMNIKEGQFYFNSEYTTVNCGHKDSNDDY